MLSKWKTLFLNPSNIQKLDCLTNKKTLHSCDKVICSPDKDPGDSGNRSIALKWSSPSS